MTAQEYIDDIKLRMLRLNIDLDLDDAIILTYINRARNEVQNATYSLYPERYSAIYELSYTAGQITNIKSDDLSLTSQSGYKSINIQQITMPANLIDIYNVTIQWQSTIRDLLWYTNARRSTKEELFSILNHAWNLPTADNMLYAIEKRNNVQYLYIGDLSVAGDDLESGTIDIKIWYISALSDLENISTTGADDQETVISPEVEELVINYAMMYCMETIHDDIAYDYIKQELDSLYQMLKLNYSIQKQRVGALLPSKEGV